MARSAPQARRDRQGDIGDIPTGGTNLPRTGAVRILQAALALLALTLAFVNLWQDWYADPYFATTVQSMRVSWHTFFYLSFDPAGFVSVDKPPLALWLQAACTYVLGFRSLSLLLPAALSGLGSLAVLYYLVQRSFGQTAGLLAALFLALTPIVVADDRSNNMDSLVMFTSLLGAWAVTRAVETGRLRPLLLCTVALALGFNAKFLQALIVLPTFALLYLLVPVVPLRVRLLRLLPAIALLLLLSFAWVTAVDLTPAGQRPYVGSSSNNTEMDLIFGYNGLSRIVPGSTVANAYAGSIGNGPGDPGPSRLLNAQLGGQIGWLLPLAVAGLIAAVRQVSRRPVQQRDRRGRRDGQQRDRRGRRDGQQRSPLLLDRRTQAMLLWGGWLCSLGLLYSVANFFHPYNLVMLAPAICALAGIGIVALWHEYRAPHGIWWLLPATLTGTALIQMAILLESTSWNSWLIPIVPVLASGACLWIGLSRRSMHTTSPRLASASIRASITRALLATGVGTLTLLIAPTLWASVPVWHFGNAEFPLAGPDLLNPAVELPASTRAFFAPPSFIRFLLAQRHGERYILAARYGSVAAPVMLATRQAVLAYGGYLGVDPILTNDKLITMVRQRQVRFFWLFSAQVEAARQTEIEGWVAQSCVLVPPKRWQPAGLYGSAGPRLFDCARAR